MNTSNRSAPRQLKPNTVSLVVKLKNKCSGSGAHTSLHPDRVDAESRRSTLSTAPIPVGRNRLALCHQSRASHDCANEHQANSHARDPTKDCRALDPQDEQTHRSLDESQSPEEDDLVGPAVFTDDGDRIVFEEADMSSFSMLYSDDAEGVQDHHQTGGYEDRPVVSSQSFSAGQESQSSCDDAGNRQYRRRYEKDVADVVVRQRGIVAYRGCRHVALSGEDHVDRRESDR